MALGLSGNGLITGFDPTASGFGKVLQVVRATDTTTRSTTSTSYVDASISVTITSQRSTSAILLIWSLQGEAPVGQAIFLQITDNSNNAISGAEGLLISNLTTSFPLQMPATIIAYATPATTSPVTFKGRFKSQAGNTAQIRNFDTTGQLYAIEVSA